jgi:hypothetical protein
MYSKTYVAEVLSVTIHEYTAVRGPKGKGKFVTLHVIEERDRQLRLGKRDLHVYS